MLLKWKKGRIVRSIVSCLLVFLLWGCSIESREIDENVHTIVPVRLNVEMDNSPYLLRQGRGKDSGKEVWRRVVAVAYKDNEPVCFREIYLEKIGQTDMASIDMSLSAGKYQLVIWSDFVEAGTGFELYYSAAGVPLVCPYSGYEGNTCLKDAFYCSCELDITGYSSLSDVTVNIETERPTAYYELIANDVDKFLNQIKEGEVTESTFTVYVRYAGYYPISFDAYYGLTKDFSERVSFEREFSLDMLDGNFLLAFDYPLTDADGTSYPAVVEIVDGQGNLMARTNLRIPCERGKKTVVRSDFLTSPVEEGIQIDTEFDGEINIDVIF